MIAELCAVQNYGITLTYVSDVLYLGLFTPDKTKSKDELY